MDWRVSNLLKGMVCHFCGKILFQFFSNRKAVCLIIYLFVLCQNLLSEKCQTLLLKMIETFSFRELSRRSGQHPILPKGAFFIFFCLWKMGNEIFNTPYIQSNFKSFRMNENFVSFFMRELSVWKLKALLSKLVSGCCDEWHMYEILHFKSF